MNNRKLAFYAVAILVIFVASYFQNLYYPAVPKNAEQADGTELVESVDSDASALTLVADDGVSVAAIQQETPAETAVTNGQAVGSDGAVKTAESETLPVGQAGSEADVAEDSTATPPSKLYTIGSLAADSKHRFLLTLSAEGAAVRRVELNFRHKKNGKIKYRDLEYKGGYLGELDCIDASGGCLVRVVGEGTPAEIAGLKPDDIIRSVNGEPVVSADDFALMLNKTKPGDEIALNVIRNSDSSPGAEMSLSVALTDKPIELIRPQPDFLDKGWPALPSFQTKLLVKSLAEVWPELDAAITTKPWQLDSQSEHEIAFSFTISDDRLSKLALKDGQGNQIRGPIKVSKTYLLHDVAESSDPKSPARDFHFDLTFKIENQSAQSQEIAYQLDGPLGTPSETWWYQNKIHGRNSAIGFVAGARDVAGSTGQEDFTFFGGPEIVANLRKNDPKYFWILKPPAQEGSADQQVKFLCGDTQYFNVALIPKTEEEPFTAYSVLADSPISDIPKSVKEQKLVDCTFRMFKVVQLEPNRSYEQTFEIFAGPKEANLLATYQLDDTRSFGWFAWFSKPLIWLLDKFHWLTFKIGYGIPIILLTMLVRSLMIPVSRKAALNAQMMQYLQPQMKELADKYKDDMEKRGQAQRDLFKKYKYNPFSGCFMMFLQIPIFIGLYRGLSVDIALRDQPLFPGLSWCSNLSAPDQFWYWKDSLPGFLDFLTAETGWLGPYLNILPIITCVLFVVQQKLFTPPPTDEQQEMMQKVMKYAMVFMGLLFFKVPSGLCLYFITSSLWGIIERKMLPKPQLDKSKLDDFPDSSGDNDELKIRNAKQEAKELAAEQKRREELDDKKRRDKDRKKRLKQRGT